jgi:hypothetical protein
MKFKSLTWVRLLIKAVRTRDPYRRRRYAEAALMEFAAARRRTNHRAYRPHRRTDHWNDLRTDPWTGHRPRWNDHRPHGPHARQRHAGRDWVRLAAEFAEYAATRRRTTRRARAQARARARRKDMR